MTRQTLTPPQLAKRWGVHPDKVLGLIHTGQLVALNLAANLEGRPRFQILLSEIQRFEESRSTKPPVPKPRRRRRATAMPVREYF